MSVSIETTTKRTFLAIKYFLTRHISKMDNKILCPYWGSWVFVVYFLMLYIGVRISQTVRAVTDIWSGLLKAQLDLDHLLNRLGLGSNIFKNSLI